ncbi:hypothetical protein [Streptomyces sp. NPDC002788]
MTSIHLERRLTAWLTGAGRGVGGHCHRVVRARRPRLISDDHCGRFFTPAGGREAAALVKTYTSSALTFCFRPAGRRFSAAWAGRLGPRPVPVLVIAPMAVATTLIGVVADVRASRCSGVLTAHLPARTKEAYAFAVPGFLTLHGLGS